MGFFSKDIEIDSYYEAGKYKLALRLCILFGSLFALLAFIESFNSLRNSIVYSICSFIPLLELYYLTKTRRYKVVYFTLSIVGTIVVFYTLNFFIEEIHYGDFLWMILLIILSYWGLDIKFGVLFLILNIFTIIYYFTFSVKTNLTSLREINSVASLSLGIEVVVSFISISIIIHQFIKFYKYSYESLLSNKLELEKSNQIITTKNEENVVLMKEVHHRVKNNLQIITSLLRLQKHNLSDDVQQKFDESINRVMTMALIHRKLYQSPDLSNVNLESYINDLIQEIFASLSTNENVSTTVRTNDLNIGLKTIVPFGLLINELLSNSFKHAFDESNRNNIIIELNSINDNFFELKYSDTGIWKSAENEQVRFGLELIDTLTEQMEGSFTRENSYYTFKLKNLDI